MLSQWFGMYGITVALGFMVACTPVRALNAQEIRAQQANQDAQLDTVISDSLAGYNQAAYDECMDSADDKDCSEAGVSK